jgi:DNA-binding Xre family transcriptional regulator
MAVRLRLKVKEVAESKGYNMSSLSRASDVHFNTIKKLWTKPYSGANLDTLNKIARALNVMVDDLFENIPD